MQSHLLASSEAESQHTKATIDDVYAVYVGKNSCDIATSIEVGVPVWALMGATSLVDRMVRVDPRSEIRLIRGERRGSPEYGKQSRAVPDHLSHMIRPVRPIAVLESFQTC